MESSPQIRRFRANPIEVVIFSVVAAIFCHSIYDLLYSPQEYRPIALSAMHSNPVSEGRNIASVSQPTLQNLAIDCEKPADQIEISTASKVRLNGGLCGSEPNGIDDIKLTRSLIANTANQFNATIFTDLKNGKFSTDYIPLNAGKNPIHLEFTYGSGKTFTQEITLNKTEQK